MYDIYDILNEIDFKVVNKDLDWVEFYSDNKIVHLSFFIKVKGVTIFDYSPKYYERYEGDFNKDAVKATVKDILNDLYREIKEQTGIKYIVSNAEREWKDSYGV